MARRITSPARAAVAAALVVTVLALAGVASSCGPSASEACARSCTCATLGRCGANDKGVCLPTKPEHCAASTMCKLSGKCTLTGNECVAGSDDDCKKSRGCETMKACTLEGRACVAPPAAPRKTPRRR